MTCLRYGLRVCPVWVSTKCNPADAPSGGEPLPKPAGRPLWAERFFQHCVAVGLDYDDHRRYLGHTIYPAVAFRFENTMQVTADYLEHWGERASRLHALTLLSADQVATSALRTWSWIP